MRITTLGVAWCTMTLIALAKPCIELCYGVAWLPCVPLLQIIAIGWAATHMSSINLDLLKVKGRSDLFLQLEIIKKTVSFVMLLIAATISVEAICWASAIYCHMAVAFNAYFTGKILGLSWWEQQKDYIPYFIFSGLACIPAVCLTFTNIPSFLQLLIGGGSSFILYFGTLHIFRESSYTELYNTLKTSKLGKLLPFKAF